jgi:hypothetical protein
LCRGWVRFSLFEQEGCSHREGNEEDFAQAVCASASFCEVAYKEVHEILERVISALEGRGGHGCFADFLRFSEGINVCLGYITLAGNDLRFRVRKAKNHRLGFEVCLPVDDPKSIGAFVLDFLQRGLKWRPKKVGFLCCQLEGGKFRARLPISYSALHASCKDLIEAVGLDPSKYSNHSAKRGSATAAVVAGCTDAEVTALGRWRSAETGKGYVHGSDKFRKRLSSHFSV